MIEDRNERPSMRTFTCFKQYHYSGMAQELDGPCSERFQWTLQITFITQICIHSCGTKT